MRKREQIIEKSLQGYSQAETARLVGCSRWYVGIIKREESLSFADGNKKTDIERDESILWNYLKGTSFASLGKRHGISAIQAFRVASSLIPCRPAQAKSLVTRGKDKTMSAREIKKFFECLESLYGKTYRNLIEPAESNGT